MRNYKTITMAAVGAMVFSSAALANEMHDKNKTGVSTDNKAQIETPAGSMGANAQLIKDLPEEGQVSLNGVVKSVRDEDTFILSDNTGDTIDVHTGTKHGLKEGDHVKVQGQMGDEALGMGEEVQASSVRVVAQAATGADRSSY